MAEAPDNAMTSPCVALVQDTDVKPGSCFPDLAAVKEIFATIKLLAADDVSSAESARLKLISDSISYGMVNLSHILGYFGEICCPAEDGAESSSVRSAIVGYQLPLAMGLSPITIDFPGSPLYQPTTASLIDMGKYIGLRCLQVVVSSAREIVCDDKLLIATAKLSIANYLIGTSATKLAATFGLSALAALAAAMLGLHAVGVVIGIRTLCALTKEEFVHECIQKLKQP